MVVRFYSPIWYRAHFFLFFFTSFIKFGTIFVVLLVNIINTLKFTDMKKVKVLRFAVEFFALCAVIAFVCTFADLWAGVAALMFGGAAMVCYLFYSYYSLNEYEIFYTDGLTNKTCKVRATNEAEACAIARAYYPEIKVIDWAIRLGVEL
jgi:fatty acid desaturase